MKSNVNVNSSKIYFLLFLLTGVTIGSFLSKIAAQNKYLSWLGFGETLGLKEPVILDLFIVNITFGIRFELYIGSIIGLIIAGILYKKIM